MSRAGTSAHSALPVLAGLLTLLAVVFAGPQQAVAHATVESTSPAHGAQVDEALAEVTVVFDEPVSLSDAREAAQVIDDSGERVDQGEAALDASRTVLTIPLREDLPRGVYVASWRVVSADTHVVGGSVQFGHGTPARAAAAGVSEMPDPVLTLVGGVAKGIVYLGLVLLLGLLPAAIVMGSGPPVLRRVRTVAEVGAVLTVLASLVQLWTQFLGSLPPSDPTIEPASFGRFASTRYALAVWARTAGVLVVLALLGGVLARARAAGAGRGRLGGATGLAVAAVLVVGTVVVNGHGGAGGVASVGFAVTLAHALAAIAWLGGLVLLGALVLRPRSEEPDLERLPRWSVYAAGAVAVLALTGAVQGLDRVGYPEALLTTTYGQVLLGKLAVVTAALLFAAVSLRGALRRRRSSIRCRQGSPRDTDESATSPPTGALALRTRREAGLVVGAVLASGVLSSLTPARDDWAPTGEATAEIGPYAVRVEIVPARVGPQALRVTVTPPAEHFAQPDELEATLRPADGGATSLSAEMPYRLPAPRDPGHPTPVTFVSAAVGVPAAGLWAVTLTIVVSPLEQYTGEVRYEVR